MSPAGLHSSIRSRRCKGAADQCGAFSLVEVTLALAVAGFCLLTVVGLLQTGLMSEKATVGQTVAANLVSLVYSDLAATPAADASSKIYGIALNNQSASAAQTLYFTEEGTPTGGVGAAPTTDSRYRVTIGVTSGTASSTPSTGAPKASTMVRILVTWPAAASPNPDAWPTNPTHSTEVVTAIDRN